MKIDPLAYFFPVFLITATEGARELSGWLYNVQLFIKKAQFTVR